MPERLIITTNCLPGRAEEFIAARLPRHAEVQKEPGCEQFELFRSVENPDKVVIIERWTTAEQLEAHRAVNRTRPQIGNELRDGPSVGEQYNIPA